jgi:hypothetical protein
MTLIRKVLLACLLTLSWWTIACMRRWRRDITNICGVFLRVWSRVAAAVPADICQL